MERAAQGPKNDRRPEARGRVRRRAGVARAPGLRQILDGTEAEGASCSRPTRAIPDGRRAVAAAPRPEDPRPGGPEASGGGLAGGTERRKGDAETAVHGRRRAHPAGVLYPDIQYGRHSNCGRRCQAKFAGTDKTEPRSIRSRLFPSWLGMTRSGEAAAACSPNLFASARGNGPDPHSCLGQVPLGDPEILSAPASGCAKVDLPSRGGGDGTDWPDCLPRNVGPGWRQVPILDRHAEIRCALCACHLTNLYAKRVCPALAGCLRAFSSR